MPYFPLILALILTIVHYFSEHVSNLIENYHSKILSFSAGLFITLIFVHLLPELVKGQIYVNIYLILLIGFIIFHLTEKFIYQHIKDKKKRLKDLSELHIIGFFIDNFMIGFVLVLTFQFIEKLNFLIFIPFLLHTISSSLSLEHIHERSKTIINKTLLGFSTLLGALIATFLNLSQFSLFTIYSFTMGALLYVVFRDMIPADKEGSPLFFLFGVLVTLIIVFLAN